MRVKASMHDNNHLQSFSSINAGTWLCGCVHECAFEISVTLANAKLQVVSQAQQTTNLWSVDSRQRIPNHHGDRVSDEIKVLSAFK